jgi:DNA-binding LacI/PurR family transcriptional regulator
MPTIKDVAREAGVSVATVSYVLNNKHQLVSAKTRRHVLEAIQRVGYTPSAMGRNFKANKSKLIGYAWHPITYGQVNTVLDQFTYFMAQAAEEAGYHILTFTCSKDDPVPVYAELIKSHRVDAFVLSGTNLNDERIAFLLEKGFPFVSFGRSNPEWQFSYVDTDAYAGTQEATQYLIQLGHRRIAFVGWPEGSLTGDFRIDGYRDAMTSAGLPVNPLWLSRGTQAAETGRVALARWLEMPPEQRPTAILCVTDLVAMGVMVEARERGLVVGRDLSVIGFDNAPLVEYFQPALTTLEQRIPEMGHILIDMIEGMVNEERTDLVQLLVKPRFIIRESCGAPPPED